MKTTGQEELAILAKYYEALTRAENHHDGISNIACFLQVRLKVHTQLVVSILLKGKNNVQCDQGGERGSWAVTNSSS